MEEVLAQQEKYYRTLIYSLHEDILVIDRDYRITDINEIALQTLERTRKEVIGHQCYEVSHGVPAPCHEHGEDCGVLRVFDTGECCFVHHEHVKADGKKVYIHILLSPLKDKNGTITHVIEAMRDVTALFQVQDALRKSEERYTDVLAATSDAVVAVDLEGNITLFNPGAEQLLRCSMEDALGSSISRFCPEDGRTEQTELLRRVIETGSVHGVEVARLTADGRRVLVEMTLNLRKDNNGTPCGIIAVLHDITGRKQAEQKVKKLFQEKELLLKEVHHRV